MRSNLETDVADLLSQMKLDWEYEGESFKYTIDHKYTPDFKVNNIYLECKGYFKPADRRKMLAVKRDNPDLDIRFVFQAPHNKISKKSKTTYAVWAEKHGFPWCAYYAIPVNWLK
tara:strand:- start:10741 stop:11085 length:345 start_codon:yes stop_codon:yes gene_type:complete